MQPHGDNYVPEHNFLGVEKNDITVITTSKIECVLLFLS